MSVYHFPSTRLTRTDALQPALGLQPLDVPLNALGGYAYGTGKLIDLHLICKNDAFLNAFAIAQAPAVLLEMMGVEHLEEVFEEVAR